MFLLCFESGKVWHTTGNMEHSTLSYYRYTTKYSLHHQIMHSYKYKDYPDPVLGVGSMRLVQNYKCG